MFAQFFSNIQERKWYAQFLAPVMAQIPNHSTLLDIGTGSGKMLELLAKNQSVKSTGTDTNQGMLDEAHKKTKGLSVDLIKMEAHAALPFPNEHFNNVTICNVLFHMPKDDVFKMLDDSRRVLKEDGRIIILTPTGQGGLLKLSRHFLWLGNNSIFIWYRATKKNAKKWTTHQILKEYCTQNGLSYSHKLTLHGFAQLEIISKS